MDRNQKLFKMSFAKVYPLYIAKVEKKGRTKDELHTVINWLTGYSEKQLEKVVTDGTDLETFFAQAPQLHPNVGLIKGVVCGVRVEAIGDPLMQQIRWLDKLVDELARGKKLSSILRS